MRKRTTTATLAGVGLLFYAWVKFVEHYNTFGELWCDTKRLVHAKRFERTTKQVNKQFTLYDSLYKSSTTEVRRSAAARARMRLYEASRTGHTTVARIMYDGRLFLNSIEGNPPKIPRSHFQTGAAIMLVAAAINRLDQPAYVKRDILMYIRQRVPLDIAEMMRLTDEIFVDGPVTSPEQGPDLS